VKTKIKNIIMWCISIIIAFCGLCGIVSGDFVAGFSLIIIGVIFNPKVIKLIIPKVKFFSKVWFRIVSTIICLIVFGTTISPSNNIKLESQQQASPITANVSSVNSESSTDKTVSSKTEVSSIPLSSIEIKTSSISASSKASNAQTVFSGSLKVHFLDVGQGDSIFIELPNEETMLIDAGNSADGNKIISYIKNKGYSTINYMVATHPHADHIGGMTTVVQGLDIKSIYMPKATHTTKTYEDLLTTIQNKGLKIKTAKAGVNIINSSDLKLDIVAPNSDSYENLNDYSAVLKLSYKEKSFLFTGDAESTSLNEIKSNIKADVLKVGHHGSSTSTSYTFLSKVSPKYAVISVGKGNSYGHPTSDTLNKLKSAGIQVYRI